MLNLFFRVLLAFLGLVALFLIVGSFLPRGFEISSSVSIRSPAERIYPMLADLRKWQEWSPWSEKFVKGLTVQLGELTSGTGAVQTWTEPRGDGKLWLTSAVENSRVEFISRFHGFPDMTCAIGLEPSADGSTTVTWSSRGELPGGPFYGWFGMMFPNALKGEFDKSLERLKQAAESSQ